MAPLPENNTLRIWMDYSSGEEQHSLLMRFDGSSPAASGISDRLTAIANAVWDNMWDTDAIIGWRYSAPSSVISLPFDGPSGNGVVTSGTPNPESNAGFLGLAARSVAGRQYHCNFFTQTVYSLAVYRQDYASLTSAQQDLHDAFNGIGIDVGADLVAIDGEALVFKQYANFGQNAYWQRKSR